ncbi:MAG TPA: PhzF family phenazine biosynthesis isomerase [Jiangellaceae bacterium]
MATEVLRYTAFSSDPAGGNPAGIVLDAAGLGDTEMLSMAADVGFSETAFLTPPPQGIDAPPGRGFTVRYFSPLAEVAFCGHATVATAVALAERIGPGELVFSTPAGVVPVTVTERGGVPYATLTSVEPHTSDVAGDDVAEALSALGWAAGELDPALPPAIANAGNNHLVLAAATRDRLAALDYDFDRLKALMEKLELTTVQLVWRESDTVFHVRDPFPVGGVVEDPATGAAAAAFGAYLRDRGFVGADESARVTLHQGHDMGRPSLLTVDLLPGDRRVRVSGTATRLE